jgi:hypothetical protein
MANEDKRVTLTVGHVTLEDDSGEMFSIEKCRWTNLPYAMGVAIEQGLIDILQMTNDAGWEASEFKSKDHVGLAKKVKGKKDR